MPAAKCRSSTRRRMAPGGILPLRDDIGRQNSSTSTGDEQCPLNVDSGHPLRANGVIPRRRGGRVKSTRTHRHCGRPCTEQQHRRRLESESRRRGRCRLCRQGKARSSSRPQITRKARRRHRLEPRDLQPQSVGRIAADKRGRFVRRRRSSASAGSRSARSTPPRSLARRRVRSGRRRRCRQSPRRRSQRPCVRRR
jgi:hypothetical protein